jgi:hypothetical protein
LQIRRFAPIGFLKAFLVLSNTLSEDVRAKRRCQNSELRAAFRVDPVSDRHDGIQIEILNAIFFPSAAVVAKNATTESAF